jgi:hypothetical protein
VTFGNADTPGTSIFTTSTLGEYSMAIDTAAGPHTVKVFQGGGIQEAVFYNMNISTGGTLDLGNTVLKMIGPNVVNNGLLKVIPTSAAVYFGRTTIPTPTVTYSGSGSFSEPVHTLNFDADTTTLDPGISTIRARHMRVRGSVINASRLTLGLNDEIASTIWLINAGSFDSAPTFDLGTGGQEMTYTFTTISSRTTGPEINPSRVLKRLESLSTVTQNLTVDGGDLTLDGPLFFSGWIIMNGDWRLIHLSGPVSRSSPVRYIIGTLVRRFSTLNETYPFYLGDNNDWTVEITPTALPSGPVDVTVTAHNGVLPGLPPAASVPFRWNIQQTGTMTSNLRLFYNPPTPGSESEYRAWRSTTGTPVIVASTVNAGSNIVTAQGVTGLSGSWGISQRPPPISVSGTVTTAYGAGIRNAIVRIVGGNLQTPLTAQTGSFGSYVFSGVEAGFEYTISVSAKRYRFAVPSQTFSSTTNVTNLNFSANPPEE